MAAPGPEGNRGRTGLHGGAPPPGQGRVHYHVGQQGRSLKVGFQDSLGKHLWVRTVLEDFAKCFFLMLFLDLSLEAFTPAAWCPRLVRPYRGRRDLCTL